MKIKSDSLISISEANQNFSKVVKKVEESGEIVILKNNKPEYVISKFNEVRLSEDDYIELVARRILSRHKHAFEELAK